MDLGLVCPRCARLSPLGATECSACQSVLWREEAVSLAASGRAARVVGQAPQDSPQVEEIPEIPAEEVLVDSGGQAPAAPANDASANNGPGKPPDLPRFGTDTSAGPGDTNVHKVLTAQDRAAGSSQADTMPPPLGPAASGQTLHLGSISDTQTCPRVVLIKGGAQDGVTYRLGLGEHSLGRRGGDIRFESDEFLSTPHARFVCDQGQLAIEDLDSMNGVFVRIRHPTPLEHEDCFLVGEQLLRVDTRPVPQFAPNERGTYFYGSPRPKGPFRLVQSLAGGGDGRCHSASSNSMSIGREDNDFNFPKDRFISGHHARVELDLNTERLMLHDLRSRNGTFLRIRGRYLLCDGDYLFIGQQLFRIELD